MLKYYTMKTYVGVQV